MELEFRPAVEDDFDLLWEINRAGLGEVVRKQFGSSEEEHRSHFEAHFAMDGVRIISTNGRSIGYLHCEERDGHNYVGGMVLTPEYQGRGIGTQLMTSIIREAHELGRDVRLQVLKSNSATAFYEKLGFVVDGETENHLQMVKPLSP